MKFPTLLPERIAISLLCELLGLSDMNQDARFAALKSHSQNKGLLFTFNQALRAMPFKISIDDTYDETGEFKPARNEYIQCIFKPKSFTLNNYSIDKGKAFTCIRQFEVSGVGFNIINNDKSNFGSYDVDLAEAYVKKSDYINFIDESGDNELMNTGRMYASRDELFEYKQNDQSVDLPIQKDVKPKNQAGKTQEVRYVEFTKYCKQRAEEKKLPDEEHQTIYNSFTPPLTIKDFYNELFKYDMKVFTGNVSDFFRDDRVKVEFSKAARNRKK